MLPLAVRVNGGRKLTGEEGSQEFARKPGSTSCLEEEERPAPSWEGGGQFPQGLCTDVIGSILCSTRCLPDRGKGEAQPVLRDCGQQVGNVGGGGRGGNVS